MDLTKVPDSFLVTLYLVDGSEEAFEAIHQRYNGSLVNLLKSMRNLPMPDIDDILQIVWQKVSMSLTSFDLDLNFRNWIYMVALNAANTYHAQKNRIKRGGKETIVPLVDEIIDIIEYDYRVGRHETDPSRILDMKERLEKVLEAIEQLPKQDRDIIHYVYIECLTWTETLELMGIAKHILQSSLERSRIELAKACA